MMDAVHPRRDQQMIQDSLHPNRQTPIGMLEHIRCFEHDLENNQRPKINPEQRDYYDAEGHGENYLAEMEARSSANVHVEIGVVNIVKTPKHRNEMQTDVPPPVGVIHHQHAKRDREPARRRQEMEQTEMMMLRPDCDEQRNWNKRDTSEGEPRRGENEIARKSAERGETLAAEGKSPLHEKQSAEERSENQSAVLIEERRGLNQCDAIHERGFQNPSRARATVSIIIPALNEAATLASTIAAIGNSASEIIIVDAGSSDGTVGIAQSLGARVLPARRQQRAAQLNLGAQNSRAPILLFLHADTSLPPGALDQIAQELEDPRVVGGAFVRRYASSSKFLRATCLLARGRNRLIGWHLGDQAMFVRRDAFVTLGGFREVDQFEDLDFSRRLTSLGRVVTLHPGVTSSSRRFQGGAIGRTVRDFGLTIRYLLRGLPTSSK